MKKYNWYIVGNGATGQVLAYMLQNAGYSVCMLTHKIQSSPITLQYQREDQEPKQWNCPTLCYLDNPDITIDKLIVTTKAHSAQTAVNQWQHKMNSGSRVYFWQNGIGFINEETLQQTYFYVVNSGIAAFKTNQNTVIHTANSDLFIGSKQHYQRDADIEQLQQAGIHCFWKNDIDTYRWLKVAINSIINPLTVIYQCKNGELINIPAAVEQIQSLVNECAHVFSQHGIAHSASDIYGITRTIIDNTQNNISSMLQDYKKGCKESEIAFINDQIIQLAGQHTVPVPTHTLIAKKIKHLFDDNH
jgi:2-dehydropantoate 2-reductase